MTRTRAIHSRQQHARNGNSRTWKGRVLVFHSQQGKPRNLARKAQQRHFCAFVIFPKCYNGIVRTRTQRSPADFKTMCLYFCANTDWTGAARSHWFSWHVSRNQKNFFNFFFFRVMNPCSHESQQLVFCCHLKNSQAIQKIIDHMKFQQVFVWPWNFVSIPKAPRPKQVARSLQFRSPNFYLFIFLFIYFFVAVIRSTVSG